MVINQNKQVVQTLEVVVVVWDRVGMVKIQPAAPASSSSATPRVKTAVLGRGW